ncbi:MAG: hypothetical protein CO189_06500 [candidate division Zixibacteria bacterium CG_4_9_14_3_um_filter_46_8]|nr:MAG: hypothetical protein CO189_06500 [candidate division Zixibacteria bacterium CG_4_9_14_3_um_filter_46_8]
MNRKLQITNRFRKINISETDHIEDKLSIPACKKHLANGSLSRIAEFEPRETGFYRTIYLCTVLMEKGEDIADGVSRSKLKTLI